MVFRLMSYEAPGRRQRPQGPWRFRFWGEFSPPEIRDIILASEQRSFCQTGTNGPKTKTVFIQKQRVSAASRHGKLASQRFGPVLAMLRIRVDMGFGAVSVHG